VSRVPDGIAPLNLALTMRRTKGRKIDCSKDLF